MSIKPICILIVFGIARASLAQPTSFTLYELGDIGGLGSSEARGINDYAIAVGESAGEIMDLAFRWENGVMQDLSQDWDAGETGWFDDGDSINNQGDIAGCAMRYLPSRNEVVLWRAGSIVAMTIPEQCEVNDHASGINDAATMIVGQCNPFDLLLPDVAVVYSLTDEEATAIEPPDELPSGTEGDTTAVNDDGFVVGFFSGATSPTRAFMWQDGVLSLIDNTLNGGSMVPYAINNAGVIVGVAAGQAFRYEDGILTTMGAGVARAINERDWAVGEDTVDFQPVPTLYANGDQLELGPFFPEEWYGIKPYDINNYGWIVGKAQYDFVKYKAWLLVPIYDKGDYDGDGDVDFQDFGKFQECFAAEPYQGPEGGLHVGCSVFDFDDDVDLDLTDYSAFQKAFTGPTAPDMNPYGPG